MIWTRWISSIRWLVCCLVLTGSAGSLAAADEPVFVEPAELAQRPDLVGKEILLDDRIRYFLESKRGQGFDELILKRTEIPCHLPARSRFARPPGDPNVVVRGTLQTVDGRLVIEVQSLNLQPSDIDRLDHEIRSLRPDDFVAIRRWAEWAERRGRELNDAKLEAKGVELETDAFWIEANRPNVDLIALADRVADRPILRELREAVSYRGFRQAEAQATTPAALEDLARRFEKLFPHAIEPKAGSVAAINPQDDPAVVYRAASELDRARLNRQLYADLMEKSLNARLAADPTQGMTLLEEAARILPDRPALADRFRQRGLAEAESKVVAMRQSEVEGLARTFRESGQPDRARHALEEWLADRRQHRLSAIDAEGRVLLAANYEKLLGDRATAGELLAEAEKIDPALPMIADAYLRLGFRHGDSGWYDPTAASRLQPDSPVANPSPTGLKEPENALRGLTQAQTRSRMGGKPDRVVRSATQGITVEQWIYRTGKNDQYISFRIDPTTGEPRVTASYTVPQSPRRF